jgi:hypothetical protein
MVIDIKDIFNSRSLKYILEVDDDATHGSVIQAARTHKWNLSSTYLSMLCREGEAITNAGRWELSRHAARVDEYKRVRDMAFGLGAVAVSKGIGIAELYPHGISRHSGDLDLVVPDTESAWNIAAELRRVHPEAQVDLTLFDSGRQVAIAVAWPSSEWVLDKELWVDLVPTPFLGDGANVPARAFPEAASAHAQNIMALAEERFQRPFGPTDVFDTAVLISRQNADDVVQLALDMRLCPELQELVEHCRQYVEIDLGESAAEKLALGVQPELDRRAHAGGAGGESIEGPLPTGLWYGMDLSLIARAESHGTVQRIGDGYAMATPVGWYFLVRGSVVRREDFEAAHAFVSSHGGLMRL